MPRSVRNFWIDAVVDGRATSIGTGPQGKDGGFRLIVSMRDKGGIVVPLAITGQEHDGELQLSVELYGNPVFTVGTER